MSWFDRINKRDLQYGRSIHNVKKDIVDAPFELVRIVIFTLSFYLYISSDAILFIYKRSLIGYRLIRKNFKDRFFEGLFLSIGHLFLFLLFFSWQALKVIIKIACSIPGRAAFLGIVTIFAIYLHNVNKYFPFIMKLDTFMDYVLFVPKLTLNIGYAGVVGTWDAGCHFFDGIGEIFIGVFSFSWFRIEHAFSIIGKGFDVFSNVLNVDKNIIERVSFNNTIGFAEVIVSGYIILLTIMGRIAMGSKIFSFLRKEKVPKRYFISKITNTLACSSFWYGTVIGLFGWIVGAYHTYIGRLRMGWSIVGALVSVGDIFFCFMTVPLRICQYTLDYFFNNGLPDFVGIFTGKQIARVMHVIEHIPEDQGKALLYGGLLFVIIGFTFKIYSCHRHYKDFHLIK